MTSKTAQPQLQGRGERTQPLNCPLCCKAVNWPAVCTILEWLLCRDRSLHFGKAFSMLTE